MAKRSFQNPTWTPTATADTSAMANSTYMAIGTGAGGGLNVVEIYEGGQATASAVNIMVFARNSTLASAGTPGALTAPVSDGPLDSRTAAAQIATASTTSVAGTTGPSRSAVTTSARLNLSFNAFGGIVRWVAAPGEEWGISGTTASISESSLSAFTGGSVGLMGAHIVYEGFVWFIAAMAGISMLLPAITTGSGPLVA